MKKINSGLKRFLVLMLSFMMVFTSFAGSTLSVFAEDSNPEENLVTKGETENQGETVPSNNEDTGGNTESKPSGSSKSGETEVNQGDNPGDEGESKGNTEIASDANANANGGTNGNANGGANANANTGSEVNGEVDANKTGNEAESAGGANANATSGDAKANDSANANDNANANANANNNSKDGAKDNGKDNTKDADSDASSEVVESGASVNKSDDLYEVMLFGESGDTVGDAAKAIVEASEENPDISNISMPTARALSTSLFRSLAAATPAKSYPYPRRADGSDVESISIRWISKDTEDNGDDSLLYLVPDGDSAFSVRFQIDYALSGEHNYEPGDIQIRIPAKVFHKRNSNTTSENTDFTGGMVIPLAQSPETTTDFNWMLVDGEYILSNTKRIVAATKGFIQFEIKDLIPHEIVDMSLTDDLQATIEVTTHLGNTIGLQSNTINAQVNTTQVVVRANKDISGTPSVQGISSVGEIPAEIRSKYPNDTEFLVVTWYTNAYHTGNQPYTLTGYDTRTDVATGATTETLHDGWVLGGDTQNTKDLGVVQEGWYIPGLSTSSSIRVAYPMSQFKKDTQYTFTNHVDYDLVPLDKVDDPTHVEADGKTVWSYREPRWVDPVGHFNVFKWGNDNDYGIRSDGDLTTHYRISSRDDVPNTSGTNTKPQHLQGWYGLYKKALNEMRDGNDVEIAYTIKSDGYILPWTYEGDTRLESSYGKRPVTMVTEDTGLWVGTQTSPTFTLKPGENIDFTSISFVKPIIGKIKAINVNPDGSFATSYISVSASGTASDGTFDYQQDNDDSKIPPIVLEVQRGGKWEVYATADFSSGSCVITMADGSVVNGDKIDFPEGTENFRTSVTSSNASIVYCVRPSVMLYNTKEWRDHIEKLFENNAAPAEDVWNGVNLKAYTAEKDQIVDISKNGFDRLMGYTADIAVIPYKDGTVGTIDYAEKEVYLKYSAKVEERSVIQELELYKEALSDGIIKAETSGTWYDLLPLGVNPVMDSIKLRRGDTIRDAYTIPNYKGSGRTMLVVEADLTPEPSAYTEDGITFYQDVPSIEFQAKCDINYIIDYGEISDPDDLFSADLHNVIAFESSNDDLGDVDGYEAEVNNPNGTNNVRTKEAWSPVAEDAEIEKNAMTGLNDGRDTKSFLYAGVNNHVEILNAASTSLLKEVSVNNDGWWSQGTYYGNREANARDVYEGGMYSYRIFMMSNANTQTRGMVLYDSLENYTAIQGNDQEDVEALAAGKRWRGTLRSVDVSLLRDAGIDAVVYYSTVPELQMQEVDDPLGGHIHEGNTDLTDSSIWVRADEYTGDLADVHAIAIDCRNKIGGGEYILQPETTVTAFVNMWAPQGEEAAAYIEQDAHAYNNIYLDCISVDASTGGEGEKLFIRQDYVKVGLVENSLTVSKVWDDDDDRDGIRPNEVTLTLYRDGRVYTPPLTEHPNAAEIENPVTVQADENGNISYTFKYLPYCDDEGNVFAYTVRESSIDGYRAYTTRSADGKTITLTNRHEPEETEIHGKKTWVGDTEEVRPSMIQVELHSDEYGDLFPVETLSVQPDADGNWNYSFYGIPKYTDHGKEIEYWVSEKRAEGGSLDPYITEVDGTNLINTYHPFGDVEFTKTIEGATNVTKDDTFDFEFSITDSEDTPIFDSYEYDIIDESDAVLRSGTVSTGQTVSLGDAETIKIKEIPQGYKVTALETVPEGYTVRGGESRNMTVRANSPVEDTITNVYRTEGYVNLRATKTLENRQMKNYQFRFNVTTDEAGEKVIDAISSRADGTVTFGAINYSNKDAGKTYTYYIHELNFGRPGYTYDTAVYRVLVAVRDNGDGTMTATPTYYEKNEEGSWTSLGRNVIPEFKNEYHAEGDLEIKAWKVLKKRDLKADEFTFELLDSEGTVIATAKNDGTGVVTFPKIHFDEKSIDKEFDYTIREVAGRDNTVIYSTETYGIHVVVSDNGDGTLSFVQTATNGEGEEAIPVFTNDLKDGKLAVEKKVQDGTIGEFKFKVKLTGPDVPKNGEYTFTKEQIGGNSSGGGGTNNLLIAGAPSAFHIDSSGKLLWFGDENEEDDSDGNVVSGIVKGIAKETKELFAPLTAYAAGADIASGTKDTMDWRITSEGELIIGKKGQEQSFDNKSGTSGSWPWYNYCEQITSVRFDGKVNVSGLLSYMFYGMKNATTIDLTNLTTVGATSMSSMFWKSTAVTTLDVSKFDVTQCDTFRFMFNECEGLQTIVGMEKWDTSNTTVFENMFQNCFSLRSVDVSKFNTSKSSRMGAMFNRCASLESIDVSNFDTSKATDLGYMFNGCASLKTLDVSNFNTAEVTDMENMFAGCSSLTELDVSNFNTKKVTTFGTGTNRDSLGHYQGMFAGCTGLTSLDLSSFDTSNATEMRSMIKGCSNLEYVNLSSFDTSNLSDDGMNEFFYYCPKLSKVDLGKKWTKWPDKGGAVLPTPPTASTSGKWVREPSKNIPAKTPAELRDQYPSSANNWAGTWVWEEKLFNVKYFTNISGETQIGETVSVKYSELDDYVLPAYSGADADLFTGWVPRKQFANGTIAGGNDEKKYGIIVSYSNAPRSPGEKLIDVYATTVPDDATTEQITEVVALWLDEGESYALYAEYEPTYTVRYAAEANGSNVYKIVDKIKKTDLDNYALDEYSYNDRVIAGWRLTDPKYNSAFKAFREMDPAPVGTTLGNVAPEGTSLAQAMKGSVYDITMAPVFLTHYTVDFAAGEGGSGSMESLVNRPVGEDTTIPESAFYRFNYHVKGWIGSDGKTYDPKGTIPKNTVKTQKLTLTADWAPDNNTVQMNNGEFEFTLKSNERAIFDKIPAGTAYEVYEETPAGWVLVESVNAQGEIEPIKTATASFTNEYNPNAASVQLMASKTLDGEPAAEGEFEFRLSENGKAIQTIKNTSGGGVTFDVISYKRSDIGTHTYTIEEIPGTNAAINYDTHTETVTVTVSDDGEGNLIATAKYDSDGAVFSNTSKPGSLKIQKTVTGVNAPEDAEFTFVVTIGAAGEFPYSGAKSGTIRNGGTITLKAGQTVTITGIPEGTPYSVSETAIPTDFRLSDEIGSAGIIESGKTQAASFTNHYETDLGPASINLEARKVLTGGILSAGQFSFLLQDPDGNIVDSAYNDAAGNVRFDLIELDTAGEYTYTILEEIPAGSTDNGDGTYTYEGIVYDGTPKTVTVIVEPDPQDPAKLVATPSYDPEDDSTMPTFKNSHETVEISFNKLVFSDGAPEELDRKLGEKRFDFTLTFEDADGNTLEEAFPYMITHRVEENGVERRVLDEEGTIRTGDVISVSEKQYAVIRNVPIGSVCTAVEADYPGFTAWDKELTIVPRKGYNGGWTANNVFWFNNEYASYGELELKVDKRLTGQKLIDGKFTFEAVDENGTVVARGTNKADGSVTFSKIPFTQVDAGRTLHYTIREAKADDPGYTYDESEISVSVTVTDNLDGTLSFSTAYKKGESGDATFDNSYEAEGEITLKATKTLTGRTLEENQFSFRVLDSEGTEVSTGTNDADGNITFAPALTFDQDDVGETFTYTIEEVLPEDLDENNKKSGYIYDTHKETVAVNVADTGYGTLKVTAEYDGDGASFENSYEAAGEVSLEATKSLTGRGLLDGQFEIALFDAEGRELQRKANAADGKVAFDPIPYTQGDVGNTYTYTMKEVLPEGVTEENLTKDGYTYDAHEEIVTVAISDNGDGTLTAIPTYDRNGAVFTNKYSAKGNIVLRATKKLSGRALEAEEFEFELLAEDGTVIRTAKNAANGRVSFSRINYTQASMVDDDRKPVQEKTFIYTIKETLPEGVTQDSLTKDGYTYDLHEETVIVTVVDNGDGTLTATAQYDEDGAVYSNKYEAQGKVSLEATKTLTGRRLARAQFTFLLKNEAGEEIERVTNAANGKVKFSDINYTQEDAGKTFAYTIEEVLPEGMTPEDAVLNGYTYDTHKETVEVAVTDNGDGTLTATPTYAEGGAAFANEYHANGSVTLKANKVLTGRNLTKDQFTFELLDEEDKVISTAKNNAQGNISFPAIKYTEENVGNTYKYTIREVKPDPVPSGYTYDETELHVTVTVADRGNGKLRISTAYEGDSQTLTNVYEAKGEISLEASKTLEGRTLEDRQFTFRLLDENGEVEAIQTNDAEGKVVFAPIQFNQDQVGQTFTYTIEEVLPTGVSEDDPTLQGYTYDVHTDTVIVSVNDNGDGALSVTADYDEDGAAFTNTYEAEGRTTLEASKRLSGRMIEDQQFTIALYDDKGIELQRKANAEDGKVIFDPMVYDEDDMGKTFTYTMKEVLPEGVTEENLTKDGYTYDAHEETITVTVTDNGNGTLTVASAYDESGAVFTNLYNADGEINLEAKKTLIGEELKADQFQFEVVSQDGKVVSAGKNDADGKVTFTSIKFTEDDVDRTYTYTIREVVPNPVPVGYVYDNHTETVNVSIADNGDGTLDVRATYDEDGAAFDNEYKGVTSVPVTKVWDDSDNQDGIRPESVTVKLFADGEDTGETLVLSEENSWKGEFANLDAKKAGVDIVYTVEEVKTEVITGEDGVLTYAIAVDGDAANGFTVTNTHTKETTSIEVTKAWDDGDNQDGIRPESVTVMLVADGEATEKTLILNEENEWKGEFTELDVKKAGVDIVYTVEEVKTEVVTGEDKAGTYAISVSGDVASGITVTNTHTPETVEIQLVKNWDDMDDLDKVRPDSIQVEILANDELVNTVTITKEEGWTGKITDLPKYRDGEEIKYTVNEINLPEGYFVKLVTDESEYNSTMANLTNLYRPWIPELPDSPGGQLTLRKTTSGAAEKDKEFEFKVEFTYKDGKTFTYSLKLKSDDWFLFDYIPVGTKVVVREITTGYTTTYNIDGKSTESVGAANTGAEISIEKEEAIHTVVFNNHKDKPSVPSKPTTTTKTTPKTTTKAVKTGDASGVETWSGILILAGLGIALTSATTARRRIRRRG